MRAFSLVLALLLLFPVYQKQPFEWRRIVPFQTTRAEIEAILGVPVSGTGSVLSYDIEGDRITVWYGDVKSRVESSCRWVLPQNTVLSFVYAPKKSFPLTELKLDLSKFKKEKAAEMENDFYYYCPEEGLTLSTRIVDGNEMLLSLERDPNRALREKFCKQP